MRGGHRYKFKYRKLPVFSGKTLLTLLNIPPNSLPKTIMLDGSLGAGIIKVCIGISRDRIIFDSGRFRAELSRRYLEEIVNNTRRIYGLTEDDLIPLVIVSADNRYYQLSLFEGCRTPTVEISGIHMHRVVVDPLFVDAKRKVKALDPKRGSLVLEICTGLGYSTYWLLKRKCRVITIEKSTEVLELASWNPWSRHLRNADILLGDATLVIENLPDNSFDYVLHDPPRISLAPELYSTTFYSEIRRVVKPRGILFHYVGEPGRKQGKNYLRGVISRLECAGFKVFRYDQKTQGVIAVCVKR